MTEVVKPIETTCPECRGPVTQIHHGDLVEYRCLVGHSYSARTMLAIHHEAEEKALWAAAVALEETAKIVEAVAAEFSSEVAAQLTETMNRKQAQAAQIRKILQELEPFRT